MRAFVRRYPAVRHATRQLRIRLPQGLGGVSRDRRPPRQRSFSLQLPRRAGGPTAGPNALQVSAPGGFWMTKKLQRGGLATYEPETLACFLAALEHARSGAVLDIGSNVGVYSTLAAARSNRRTYAFEPTPAIAAAARAVAVRNNLPVQVVELALSSHSGTGPLFLSATSDASNSLARGFRPSVGRLPVQLETLSHWQEAEGVCPSILKLDTEAAEPDVIAGGLEVLRRFRPWVFCEVLPGWGVEERLMALLEPLEYRWYHLCGDPPYRPRPNITGNSPDSTQRMWLFAPTVLPEGVWDTARAWRRAIDTCIPLAGQTAE